VIPINVELDWLVQGNPKRIGSPASERFEKSFGAATVTEYRARAAPEPGDLRADIDRGFSEFEFAAAACLMTPIDPPHAYAAGSRSTTTARSKIYWRLSKAEPAGMRHGRGPAF
jgi:hypothetical protein